MIYIPGKLCDAKNRTPKQHHRGVAPTACRGAGRKTAFHRTANSRDPKEKMFDYDYVYCFSSNFRFSAMQLDFSSRQLARENICLARMEELESEVDRSE